MQKSERVLAAGITAAYMTVGAAFGALFGRPAILACWVVMALSWVIAWSYWKAENKGVGNG